jgi:hypothetical protein
LNGHPGDIVARTGKAAATTQKCSRADDDDGYEEHRKHTPEGKLAPHTATIDD